MTKNFFCDIIYIEDKKGDIKKMRFAETKVFNFEGAFRGLRNPLNSWDRSDSYFGLMDLRYSTDQHEEVIDCWITQELNRRNHPIELYNDEWEELYSRYAEWLSSNEMLDLDCDLAVVATLGPNDLALAQKLVLAGDEHAKFMRQIFVCVDITAPIYWWKEMDTYKIGTVANSTSTMHKLATTPISLGCFEVGDYESRLQLIDPTMLDVRVDSFLSDLEQLRQLYLQTKDKRYWKELMRWLPESWLQTRTMTMSYANLRNIYFQRKNHKLTEWHTFCNWIKGLPYSGELIALEEKKTNETN